MIKVDLLFGAEWMRCVISLTHVVYDGGKIAALMRDEVLLWAYWQNQDTHAYLHVMRRWEVTSSVNVSIYSASTEGSTGV